MQSVRFMSLAQPGAAALRVRCPKGLRVGPPLQPPTEDPVHDEGRSGSSHWVRVAASSGGILAAATQQLELALDLAGAPSTASLFTEPTPNVFPTYPAPSRISNGSATTASIGCSSSIAGNGPGGGKTLTSWWKVTMGYRWPFASCCSI